MHFLNYLTMARILGIDIPNEKRIEIALTRIYGIGLISSKKILKGMKINPDDRTKDISSADLERIKNVIEKEYTVEGELRTKTLRDIKRLKEIGSYRGDRHRRNLPARGQKSKRNARTKRGKKITIGSGRKKAAEKT